MKKNNKIIAFICYALATICVCTGLYKLFIYDNGEFLSKAKNAYVGGDAYNYIINSNYAVAYFTLGLIFVVLGSLVVLISKINESKELYKNED